jgi:hypothetical protein
LVTLLVAVVLTGTVNATGDLAFVTALGSTGNDNGGATIIDGSGNIFVTGTFEGTVDFDPSDTKVMLTSAGGRDVFVAKYSSTGALVWARQLGGSGDDRASGLARTSKLPCKNPPQCENIYITGSFTGTADFDPGDGTARLTSDGLTDIFICTLDGLGNYVWARRLGGPGVDTATDIAVDASDNIYTTGYFSETVDFDPGTGVDHRVSAGGADVFIVKLDRSGAHVWSRRMGGIDDDGAGGLAIDTSGNVYATGSFRGTARFMGDEIASFGSDDIFVIKLDSEASRIWVKQMGGSESDAGNDIDVDASGNVYTTGTFKGRADFDPGDGVSRLTSAGNDDVFVSKLDRAGHHVWTRRVGGSDADRGEGITKDSQGHVYIIGSFRGTVDFDPADSFHYNLASAGSTDIFALKLNSSGLFIWARGMGGSDSDAGSDIAVDLANNVVVTGLFAGTADFNSRLRTVRWRTSSGGADIFLAKLTQLTPDLGFAIGVGSDEDDFGRAVVTDSEGNVYVTGAFRNTVNFDPRGPVSLELSSASYDWPDVFVAKYSSDGRLAWVRSLGGTGFDAGFDITVGTEGSIYVTGRFEDVAWVGPVPEPRISIHLNR